ncbi:hypothetical protein ACI8AG_09595 [Blastococcus sp. SYSU DS0552]
MSAPGVITGAFRSPVRELSELLGVWVTDVHHCRVIVGGRPQPDLNAWRLHLPTARYGLDSDGQWSHVVKSRELRSPWWLNRWARIWGRSPDLPELTKADGRRALRLMHEAVEAKPADTEHDTTITEGINR